MLMRLNFAGSSSVSPLSNVWAGCSVYAGCSCGVLRRKKSMRRTPDGLCQRSVQAKQTPLANGAGEASFGQIGHALHQLM